MPPLDFVQPSSEMQGRLEELAAVLTSAGAKVAEAMPDVDQRIYFRDYLTLLALITSAGSPRGERETRAGELTARGGGLALATAAGLTMDAAGYLELLDRRERARMAWQCVLRRYRRLGLPDRPRCGLSSSDRSER